MTFLTRYLKEATQGHSKVNAKLLHSFEVLMPTKFFLLFFILFLSTTLVLVLAKFSKLVVPHVKAMEISN
jgi:hypothetical protein